MSETRGAEGRPGEGDGQLNSFFMRDSFSASPGMTAGPGAGWPHITGQAAQWLSTPREGRPGAGCGKPREVPPEGGTASACLSVCLPARPGSREQPRPKALLVRRREWDGFIFFFPAGCSDVEISCDVRAGEGVLRLVFACLSGLKRGRGEVH